MSEEIEQLKEIPSQGFEDYVEEEYLPNKLSTTLSGLTPEDIKDLLEAIEKIKK